MLTKTNMSLTLVSVIAGILCIVPIMFNWKYQNLGNSMFSDIEGGRSQLFDSVKYQNIVVVLAAGVALSIPMALQIIVNLFLRIESFDDERICFVILIVSLFLPDIVILLVALPGREVNLLSCMTALRYVLFFYAMFGHLWQSRIPIFRSNKIVLSHWSLNICIIMLNMASFVSGSTADILLIIGNIFCIIALLLITLICIQWLWDLHKTEFSNLTETDYSCTGYVVLTTLVAYATIAIILFNSVDSADYVYFLALKGVCATVIISIIKSIVDHKKLLTANLVSKNTKIYNFNQNF